MKIELKVQKDSVSTLKEEILSHSNSKLKKIYVTASDVKESGYDIVEECLIDLKARKFIALGIDKKNTTRKMLENVLKYTKNVYIWDNNADVEFNANVFVFEYEDEAFVYLVQGGLTDSMLETDLSMYTKVTYDLVKDKKEYEEYIDTLTKEIKDSFVKLTKEYIDMLAEQKLIFTTKQYMHVVPSIAELLGKKDEVAEKAETVEPQKLPKIELGDMDLGSFEIDLGDMANVDVEVEAEYVIQEPKQEVAEEVETDAFGLDEETFEQDDEEDYVISDEAIDMEALVLESKVVKIDKETIESGKKKGKKEDKEAEKQASKKINLDKVSNIIMELASKPTKGKDVNKIKIPNYIKDMIPNFFEIMEDALVRKTDDGEYKEAVIKLEVIDVNNGTKHVDAEAKIRQKVGQTYIEFETDKLIDVAYEELDIARVIKLAKDSYHIEIIPQGIEEYSLWDKLCTNSFRGSNRQYGLM
ncbi:MAG: hypothetical protein IJ272_01995 [Clostridia bacterium]|nr:hypothetical protein [Clostridia bacterium]